MPIAFTLEVDVRPRHDRCWRERALHDDGERVGPVSSAQGLTVRAERALVRKQRHDQPAPEKDGARDRLRPRTGRGSRRSGGRDSLRAADGSTMGLPVSFLQAGDGDADQREPLTLDQRPRVCHQASGRHEDHVRLGRRPRQGVRERVARARSRRSGAGSPRCGPPARRVACGWRLRRRGHQDGVDLVVRPRPLSERARANRATAATDLDSPAIAVVGERVSWRPEARPSIETRASSASCATSPTVLIPRPRSFAAVTAPTPQRRSTGNG